MPSIMDAMRTSNSIKNILVSSMLHFLFISLLFLVEINAGGDHKNRGKQGQATAFQHLIHRLSPRFSLNRGSRILCCSPFGPAERAASVRQKGSAQLPLRMSNRHETDDHLGSPSSPLDMEDFHESNLGYQATWKPWSEVELKNFVAKNKHSDKAHQMAKLERPPRSQQIDAGGDIVLSEVLLKSDKFINGYSLGEVPRVARRTPITVKSDPGTPYPDVVSPDGMQVADFMVQRRAERGQGSYSEEEEGRRVGGRAFYKYDPAEIARYYDKRPLAVLIRLVEAGLPLGIWAASVLWDKATNKLEQNQALRAREIRDVLSKTGPTTVKFGQALSNRPDVVGPVYIEELQQLQDNVSTHSDVMHLFLAMFGFFVLWVCGYVCM
jgi:hypothetical protein